MSKTILNANQPTPPLVTVEPRNKSLCTGERKLEPQTLLHQRPVALSLDKLILLLNFKYTKFTKKPCWSKLIIIYIYIYIYIQKTHSCIHNYMLQTLLPVNIINSRLSTTRCFRSTDYCEPYGRRIQLLVTLGANERWVMAVTQLYDEIYVVCDESPSILVYKAQEPFSRLDDVVVKEMKKPLDIAACLIVRCLYVCDRKEKCF